MTRRPTSLLPLLALAVACAQPESDTHGGCSNQVDDDGDGLFDCDDSDCWFSPECEDDETLTGPGDTGEVLGPWGGTPAGTGTTTTTGSFSVTTSWVDEGGCDDRLNLTILDPLGVVDWSFGMVEQAPVAPWSGEDCMFGYASYNYCHDISAPFHTLQSSCGLPLSEGEETLFSADHDPNLTYYLDDGGWCAVWGADPAYYAALGCEELQ